MVEEGTSRVTMGTDVDRLVLVLDEGGKELGAFARGVG
jgi:hypothetical protein